MRGWRAVLMMLVLVASGVRAADAPLPDQIRLASEVWDDYTDENGRGMAWDILRKVFEPAGVKVDAKSAPYTRAQGLVNRGEADAWVGSYHEESDEYLYPRWHFDSDHIYALSLRSTPVPTRQNIGEYKLAWVRGYDYQHYLPNIPDGFREIQRRDGILPMLEKKRVDFYIDAQTEVDYVLKGAADPAQFRSTHIAELPLYLAFGKTERGRALSALFDRRMPELVANGELRAIFAHWQQPYPFDDPATFPH